MTTSDETQQVHKLGEGISDDQVDDVLNLLREKPLFIRFFDKNYEQLPKQLRFFIETTAHEAAPDDPIQREQVAAAMFGLWALLNSGTETATIEQIIAPPDILSA